MKISKKNSKGFLISADSFLALTLLFVFILFSFFYISKTSSDSWNELDLITAARDESAVLEKSGVLESSVKSSSSDLILEYLSSTPHNYCYDVGIFSPTNLSLPIISVKKSGCFSSSEKVSSAERTFMVVNDSSVDFYIARILVWIK